MALKPNSFKLISEKKETTAFKIEKQIKSAVLDGRLSAGEFLGSENDLAAKFEVSRLPVREAVGRLAALGVVEVRTGAGGGVRIARGNPMPAVEALALQLTLVGISPKEVFDAWRCVERAVLKQAAELATTEDLAKIEAAIAAAEAVMDTRDEFTHAAFACHQAETDAAHNHVLSVNMAAILYVLFPTANLNTSRATAKKVVAYHRTVLNAIRLRDGEQVQNLVDEYTEKVRKTYFESVSRSAK